jgi:uncharacterized repeat protein (TIGR01451 family)
VVDGLLYEPDSIVDNITGTQTLTWLNIGAMNPGDTIIVTFEADVDPKRTGTFINTAIVTGTSVIGDVTDEDESPIGVLAPAILVTKSVYPAMTYSGYTVVFTLVITNTGEVLLDPVMVIDTLPKGLTYANAASMPPDTVIFNPDGTTTITWLNIGALISGESKPITFEAVFNGEEVNARNNVTATGTPPNGFPVSDDDFASVIMTSGTPKQPGEYLQPLAYHGMIECYTQFQGLIDRIRKAHPDIEWRRHVPCCEALEDLVEQLVDLVLEQGLDKVYPEKWERVQELLPYVELCCKNLEEYYKAGNYVAANYWIHERNEAYEELIELLLEILGL